MAEGPLLVLGGGRNQAPLIRRIEDSGIPVLVADYLPHSPGHRLATHSSLVSTFDIQASIELATEYDIRGVMTTGTDQPLVTMAEVAQARGLPCYLTPDQARLCTDKVRMLEAFADNGLPVPPFRVLERGDDPRDGARELAWPLVVKPVDSQGQRGVSVVHAEKGLDAACVAARNAGGRGTIIIQSFVSGPEITITGWVMGGRFQLGSITDRHTFNRPPATGVCFQHVYPSRQVPRHQDCCRDLAERIAAIFGLREGPLYIQCLVEGDQVWLVEATCRLGGGHEARLVEHATGILFDPLLLQLALTGECREAPALPPFPVPDCFNLVNFLLASPGEFATLEMPPPGNGLLDGDFYAGPGYRQGPLVNGLGRVGYLHCTGDSRDRMLDNAHAAYLSCRIDDPEGHNLLFWPDSGDLNL